MRASEQEHNAKQWTILQGRVRRIGETLGSVAQMLPLWNLDKFAVADAGSA